MNIPVIKNTLSGYQFSWHDEKILIAVSNLKYNHDILKAEIKITTAGGEHLHQANFNFSSTRAKTDLVKTLSKTSDDIDWDLAVEQLRVKTLELYRQGDSLELIDSEDDISDIEYILHPLIPKNQFSLIYGEGGTGKSTLALFFALLIQSKTPASQYGFSMNGTPSTVLYLDWETSRDVINSQFTKLCHGLKTKERLYYRRCNLPLAQDIENIKQYIQSANADVLIVDSVGVASGSDLNESLTANLFAASLRSLKTTSFVISHTSKDRSDKKTPFGSVYFYNNARNIWEIKRVQSEGDDVINVGLFHRKSNISRLHAPIGFKFTYQPDNIIVESQKVSDIGDFEKELPLRQRIKGILLQEGLLTINDIANQLGADQRTVRSRLTELRSKGDIIKQGDKFAIYYHEQVQ